MKLLLDENLPHRMRQLLSLAGSNGFDAVITKDTRIPYEQNVNRLPCALIVLEAKSNSMNDVAPLVPATLAALASLQPNSLVRIRWT